MLPAKASLMMAAVSFHLTPIIFEAFTVPDYYGAVVVSAILWDSRRAPPRTPQRSILRI